MHRAAAIVAALAPTLVLACHPHLERRGPVNAARGLDRSSEAAEALITDAQAECSYYSYPPANEIVSRPLSVPDRVLVRAETPGGQAARKCLWQRSYRLHLATPGLLEPEVRSADRSVAVVSQINTYPTIWATADLSNP